jgi:hypothetical protein
MRGWGIGSVLGLTLAVAAARADAAPVALTGNLPYQATGANTGTVGGIPVSATSASNLWYTGFLARDYGASIWGSLALPGVGGHMFGVVYASGSLDTVTITLGGPIQDPTFYIIDIDGVGATVTVSPGGTTFVCVVDCTWSGNVATVNLGAPGPQGTSGSPAVRYAGLYGAGSQFSFVFDYRSAAPVGGDIVGIGIGTLVPEPASAVLLALGLVSFALARSRAGSLS